MDPFQQLVYSQRPDVRGHSVNDWWTLWGANELRSKLQQLGRQDVLNVAGNDNNWLKQWYIQNGSYEYPNIWQASVKQEAPKEPIAKQYAAAGGTAPKTTKTFEEVLPYFSAWSKLRPGAEASAYQQVRPEIQRAYNAAMQNYMNQMASAGGGRFGRALGGTGDIWAQYEREKKAQVQDWINQYEQGFRELFYEPSEEIWTNAMTQGTTGTVPKIPTWEQYARDYGIDIPTSKGGDRSLPSPIYSGFGNKGGGYKLF